MVRLPTQFQSLIQSLGSRRGGRTEVPGAAACGAGRGKPPPSGNLTGGESGRGERADMPFNPDFSPLAACPGDAGQRGRPAGLLCGICRWVAAQDRAPLGRGPTAPGRRVRQRGASTGHPANCCGSRPPSFHVPHATAWAHRMGTEGTSGLHARWRAWLMGSLCCCHPAGDLADKPRHRNLSPSRPGHQALGQKFSPSPGMVPHRAPSGSSGISCTPSLLLPRKTPQKRPDLQSGSHNATGAAKGTRPWGESPQLCFSLKNSSPHF